MKIQTTLVYILAVLVLGLIIYSLVRPPIIPKVEIKDTPKEASVPIPFYPCEDEKCV